eukprot:TRINITY_DN879_c0_g2_i1.p1 TRINITY_DN879_c0_g2~~TRINITY_DN879_c0_g2_i1.p1  ORF type:complete len:328 (-),score=127.26 TRINITY_DN879_c0_g2_i1:1340-2323(-)
MSADLAAPKRKYLTFEQQLKALNEEAARKKGLGTEEKENSSKKGSYQKKKKDESESDNESDDRDEKDFSDSSDEDGDGESGDDSSSGDDGDSQESRSDSDEESEDVPRRRNQRQSDDDEDDDDEDEEEEEEDDDDDEKNASNGGDAPAKKKRRKHAPAEMSSKRPVSVIRKVVEPLRKRTRDPRFDGLSGNFSESSFQKQYGFLDEYRKRDMEELDKKRKATKDPMEKERISRALDSMKQQEYTKKKKEEKHAKEMEWKKLQLQLANKGKKPFYLKKSDQRKLDLIDRYESLKKSGQLEAFLEKKRKRNASKDHKLMPRSRREGDSS